MKVRQYIADQEALSAWVRRVLIGHALQTVPEVSQMRNAGMRVRRNINCRRGGRQSHMRRDPRHRHAAAG